jgi:hypothetical protein
MKKATISILVLLISSSIFAQGKQWVDSLEKKYPNSDGTYLKFIQDATVSIDKKKGLIIKTNVEEERIFFNQRGRLYSEESIHFSYHLGLENVEAYSIVPTEKKDKIQKVKEFDTTNAYSSSIFYDDSKNLNFLYNGLQKGARSVLKYTEIEGEPHFFGSFYMGTYMPIEYGRVRIEFPKSVKINYQEKNFDGYNVTFTKTEGKKTNVYLWEFSEVPKYKYVSGAVGMAYLFPVLLVQISEYQWKDSTVKLIPDLDHLYKWYFSNVEKSKDAKDDSLRTIVEEITKNDSTELQKVQSVFNWVQNNIEYVAIEYGSGGIVPREAGLVYQRRYGDCKDMSCLTHKMLKSIDIESNLTWIGTRRLPYKYSEIPSPLIDNHMICTYQTEDSTYFLDATDPTVPFGAPTTMIQSKEALLEKGPDNYEIKTVPVMPAEFSGYEDSCELKIVGDELHGTCSIRYKGYTAGSIRSVIKRRKGEELRKYIENQVSKGGNKFYLTDYSLNNVQELNKDLMITYGFTLKDHIQQVGDEIYLDMNLRKPLKYGKFDTTKFVYDYNGDFAFVKREKNILKLSGDQKIEFVPEGNSQDKGDYSYSITYQNKNNEIELNTEVVIDYTYFPTSRFEEYNKVVSQINRDYNETLLIKKIPQ